MFIIFYWSRLSLLYRAIYFIIFCFEKSIDGGVKKKFMLTLLRDDMEKTIHDDRIAKRKLDSRISLKKKSRKK